MRKVRGLVRSPLLLAVFVSGVVSLAASPLALATIGFDVGHPLFDRSDSQTGQEKSAITGSILEDRIALPANDACADAYIGRLELRELRHATLKNQVDYCAMAENRVPNDARAIIEKIGAIHKKIAEVVGLPAANLFVNRIEVQLTSVPPAGEKLLGSVSSGAGHLFWDESEQGLGVKLLVLPNWTLRDFPESIYAHEVVHMLAFSPGPIGDALVGLQDHPFLIESLPDLVSAVVFDLPKFQLGERELPDSLRNFRDGTPVQSLNGPFGNFYNLRDMDRLASACEKLNLANESEFTRSFCRTMSEGRPTAMADIETSTLNRRITRKSYTEESLLEPFAAEDCRVVTRTGLVYFDNCDVHQFGSPLVSFFFRLRALTGRHHLAAFVAQLRGSAPRTAIYECGFALASETSTMGGAKAQVKIRPLLGAFLGLRESLDAAQQSSFDLAWREHGMDKMVDLDRLYRTEALAGFAQLFAKSRNTYYSRTYGCGNVYDLDPNRCLVTCQKKP